MWWLIALRGLRRGEAVGLRWDDVDLDRRQITITQQLTMCGRMLVISPPKSAASRRTIALDRRTVEVLRAHGRRRHDMRIAAGSRWTETGYVFTRPNGLPVQPDYLTQRFHLLIERHDLPPVWLHDLRHGAASLAHSAGADLKTVQDQLGHASIVLTADTYTSVLPPQQYRAADATARLILTAARAVRGKLRRHPTSLAVSRPCGPQEHRPGQRPVQPAAPGQANHKKQSKRTKRVQKRARRAMAKARHRRGNH